MHRYLLFDESCSLCSGIAEKVRSISDSWLDVRSFSDGEIRAMVENEVDRSRPALVVTGGKEAEVFQGLRLSVELARGLGIRRSLRILGLVSRDLGARGAHRRSLLKGFGGALALAAFGSVPAKATSQPQRFPSESRERLVKEAYVSAGVEEVLEVIERDGFYSDFERAETAFIELEADSYMVMLFTAHREHPVSDAAVIMQKVDGGKRQTRVEYVSGDIDNLLRDGEFHPEELVISRPVAGAAPVPLSAGAYVGCIASCVGASCGLQAVRCAGLSAMPLVLSCMAVVCGSKARTCHGVCRRLW